MTEVNREDLPMGDLLEGVEDLSEQIPLIFDEDDDTENDLDED